MEKEKVADNLQRDASSKTELNQILGSVGLLNPDTSARRCSDRVYDYVVEKICKRHLPDGMHLVERELAESLKVSHIPVREALSRLDQDGWVQHTPRKGAFVKCFGDEDIRQIYRLRRIIEVGAVGIVAETISPEQEETLIKLVNLIEKAERKHDKESYRDADIEFHRLFVCYANLGRLQEYYESLIKQIRYVCYAFWSYGYEQKLYKTLQSWVTHRMILEAILNRNSILAEQLIMQHLKISEKGSLEMLHFLEKEKE